MRENLVEKNCGGKPEDASRTRRTRYLLGVRHPEPDSRIHGDSTANEG